ncbi:MAG TPA: sigma-70 family RNA polymerase sigma factor [Verrucomicrobiae bacterium]
MKLAISSRSVPTAPRRKAVSIAAPAVNPALPVSIKIAPVPVLAQAEEADKKTIVVENFSQPVPVEYEPRTAYSLYLREVGETKLLSAQEEIELAARIKKGDEAARERMIRANLRLVVKIARDYEDFGLPLLDLINEGNIGLMKAVERFDPAKGAKFSTYSAWWIKQSIKRALANQSKTIRLPVHMVDKIAKMRRAVTKLTEELGREPSDEEVGEEMGIKTRRVRLMRLSAMRPASLDQPIGEDDSNVMGDLVQDERAVNAYEDLEKKTLTAQIADLVKHLDPREASILRYRFGLEGGKERTLEEVGKKFGVTRERIRQLQNSALLKLRKMMEQADMMQAAA